MHHGIIQQREGMRAAPPARRIGGIPAMGGEAIPLVFLQTVEPAHVLRIPHPLEHAHVLPAGKHVGAVDAGVDAEHAPGDEFPLVELAVRQLGGQRGEEIPPNHGLVGDGLQLAGGDFREIDHIEMPIQKILALLAGGGAVVKQMERVIVFIFRVNPVGREPAAQTVGAIVHDGDGLDDGLPVHARARLIEYPRDGAPGRDAHLPFLPHMADRPFGGAAACRRPCYVFQYTAVQNRCQDIFENILSITFILSGFTEGFRILYRSFCKFNIYKFHISY